MPLLETNWYNFQNKMHGYEKKNYKFFQKKKSNVKKCKDFL